MSGTSQSEGSHPPLQATVDGVLKRTTYMVALSRYGSSPKWTIGNKGPSSLLRSSSTPAPGTYDLPGSERSKFKNDPKFSFGGSSRFGLDGSPQKRQPGP